MNWQKACRPLELGNLGIRDLQRTGIVLHVKWFVALGYRCIATLAPSAHPV